MSTKIEFCKETNIWTAGIGTDQLFSETKSMGATILEYLAKLPPEKILEHHYESKVNLTAYDIMEKSKICAQNLMNEGIVQGDIIIIFSQVNEDVTPLIVACLLIGAIFNTFETNFSDEDTLYALNLLQPKAIIYDEKFLPKIQYLFSTSSLKLFLPFGKSNTSMSNVLFKSIEEDFEPIDFGCAASKIAACIIFTSGTTAHPKGVLVSQSLLRHEVLNWWTMKADDILFVASPLRWISHLSLLFRPLFSGCLRIASNSPANPEYFCKVIKEHKVTQFFGVVGLLSQMLVIGEQKMSGCLDSLKGIASGGEVVSWKIRKDVGNLLPHCKLISLYGMSEVGGVVAHNEFLEDKSVNGGYLLPGFEFKVVDNNYNSLNPGENGVLFLKYKEGFLKYYKNDTKNNQSFTDDDWYNTGDYGNITEEGVVEVYGRCKDNIWCNEHLVEYFISKNCSYQYTHFSRSSHHA